jgi:hypothetical protein
MQVQRQQQAQQEHARRESATSPKLDDRYGKIGIPAVAAAVRCRGEERKSDHVRYEPQDCD